MMLTTSRLRKAALQSYAKQLFNKFTMLQSQTTKQQSAILQKLFNKPP
ncbi:hypothetical protein KP509_18G016600 [Ceratopteris richardii]|uniref:Uncharacterized protein n=1 Tax=Ceratopteris richardii TaxID=49495 RepID=A0A8T2SPV4_CERRI|nr:hypothetical protein KP509_18G016600 [Ceratopteris richardii]